MTKASKQKVAKRKTAEPFSPSRAVLSPVMQFDDPGQLTVPDHLNLGNDGKLYLTRSGETGNLKTTPQPISLKESVAWFRLGHRYGLKVTQGEGFGEWLEMVESGLA